MLIIAQYEHVHEIDTDNKWQMGRITSCKLRLFPVT